MRKLKMTKPNLCATCGKTHKNEKFCSWDCSQFQVIDEKAAEKYRSKKWLNQKYHKEKLATTTMAEILGCDPSTIQYWMKKHGIEIRTMSEAKTEDKKYTDEEWLKENYIEKRFSTSKLAKMCDCTRSTIRFWLKRFGIKTREAGGVREYFITKDWLQQKYLDKFKNMEEISNLAGCSPTHISYLLNKYNIPTRQQKGDNHHRWKGGVTPLHEKIRKSDKYIDWRNQVYERDNYTCRWCGDRGDINADHITPFSYILEDHQIGTLKEAKECDNLWDLDNGRTLCVECHKSTPTYLVNERYDEKTLFKLDRKAKTQRLEELEELK